MINYLNTLIGSARAGIAVDNILDTDCEAIVSPGNCVGVMGAGLVRQVCII